MKYWEYQEALALWKEKNFTEYKHFIVKNRIKELKKEFSQFIPSFAWIRALIFPNWKKYVSELKDTKSLVKTYRENYFTTNIERYSAFFNGKEQNCRGLNSSQICAILENETENLLIAGPGSGKTRVIIFRTAFYIQKKHFPPEKILILAFNNSAVAEVRERLKTTFNIEGVQAYTFHALGLAIIRHHYQEIGKEINILSNSSAVILDIITSHIKQDPLFQINLMNFFSEYLQSKLQSENDRNILNNEQLETRIAENYLTLDGVLVRSIAECDIANFFLYNQIKYQYEILADWVDKSPSNSELQTPDTNILSESSTNPEIQPNERQYHPDFYLPEYDIYLEHWAIGEKGETPEWFKDNPGEYQETREWKRQQFEKHQKILWETDYPLWRAGKLQERLMDFCQTHKIPLKPISYEQMLNLLGKGKETEYILLEMIGNYISAAKNAGYDAEAFSSKVVRHEKTLSDFDLRFFRLVIPIFRLYQEHLQSADKLDFSDMINVGTQILENEATKTASWMNEYLYDLIMVDEYQDISSQRFRFLQSLRFHSPDNRLFCVGDDWQAIYGFTGASNTYITSWKKYFPDGIINFLPENYRNPQGILNYGSEIIEKTSDFVKKEFSPLNLQSYATVQIHRIKANDGWHLRDMQVEPLISLIKKLVIEKKTPPHEIMVLSRFNFNNRIIREKCEDDPTIQVEISRNGISKVKGVRFLSSHKSKGLEADYVIVNSIFQGEFGFPSEIMEKLNFSFIRDTEFQEMDEEFRLFFVALTRARKKVHLFTWEDHESEVIKDESLQLESIYRRIQCMLQSVEHLGYIPAKIIAKTQQAVLLQSLTAFGNTFDLWVPNSVICSQFDPESTEIQKFAIEPWWIKKYGPNTDIVYKLPMIGRERLPQYNQLVAKTDKILKPKSINLNKRDNTVNQNRVIQPVYVIFQASIRKETAKAILVARKSDLQKWETYWLPKSVILNKVDFASKKIQNIHIIQSFYDKNIGN